MKITIDQLIKMKEQKANPFGTRYNFLIMNIENDLLSKSDGEARVKSLLADYEDKAKLFIVHQFMRLRNEHIANQLVEILSIDKNDTFLEDKYASELLEVI
ncbi:hypothetical protein [Bacillus pumilus]|uniref:hypothetical protein n=1 Tax=Bacillus pumilus TaxID=1408 RepID=UPI0022801468|nr:hypothetical protein [Bacillus pumilus]MCY7576688.1 hypothetical protein [Bacillus pumilus]